MVDKKDILVILGTAHLESTLGKCSPDGRFREYAYSRERVAAVKAKLEGLGYQVAIDYEDSKPLATWTQARKRGGYKAEQNAELQYRVRAVNALCRQYKYCVYVSMHTDAAGGDGKWHNARGFSARVSPQGSKNSQRLGKLFTQRAALYGMLGNRCTPPEGYWKQSLYVLNNTICPAVLTETGFQDNEEDVGWLLSDEGKHMVERLHVESIVEYIEGL